MNTNSKSEKSSDRRTFMAQLGTLLGSAAVGSELNAQTASTPFAVPVPTLTNRPIYNSDVGSMWPLVQKHGTRAFFPYSYTRDNYTDLKIWKHVTRNRLVDLLHHTPVQWPPGPTKIKETDAGDFIVEEITFNTTKDNRVPAFVLVPKNAAKRRTPAVILMHDHGGFYMWGKEKMVKLPNEHSVLTDYRQRYFDGQSIGNDLARQGYLVVVIDMLYWGNRRYMMDGDVDSWWDRPNDLAPDQINTFNVRASTYEHLLDRTLLSAGTTWAGISAWDDMRTVDYLWSRPEVDRSRIGCVGFSTGGMRAMMVAALDDRIKATVNACWMTSMPYQLQNNIRFTMGYSILIPGMFRYMDFSDLAALSMPGALMVLGGGKDNFFNQEGVKASYEQINKSFVKGGFDDRLYIQEYDTGHVFNRQMQETTWNFLKKHLMDLA